MSELVRDNCSFTLSRHPTLYLISSFLEEEVLLIHIKSTVMILYFVIIFKFSKTGKSTACVDGRILLLCACAIYTILCYAAIIGCVEAISNALISLKGESLGI